MSRLALMSSVKKHFQPLTVQKMYENLKDMLNDEKSFPNGDDCIWTWKIEFVLLLKWIDNNFIFSPSVVFKIK